MANSNPGLIAYQVPTPAQWNGYFTAKVDAEGGTADNLTLTGAVLAPTLQLSTSYANDVQAAAGGIAVGQLYRNGNILVIRQSYVLTITDTVTTSELWSSFISGNYTTTLTTSAVTSENMVGTGHALTTLTDTVATSENLTVGL